MKMPCHLLLGKLAAAAPDQITQALPRLVDPLQKTLHAKVKTDAVKQEVRQTWVRLMQKSGCEDTASAGQ